MFEEERFAEPTIVHPHLMGRVGLVLLIATLFGAATMALIERGAFEALAAAGLP